MHKISMNLKLFSCLIFCFLVAGCFPSKYVERQQYMFSAPFKHSKHTANYAARKVLISRTSIAVPFDQLFFLYRISDTQYVTDFYNGFLVSPAQQFDGILVNYLYANANFYPVTIEGAEVTEYFLNTEITEIYADYRNRDKPQAVIGVHMALMQQDKDKDKTKIILTKRFRAATPLCVKDTASLMAAWNADLRIILREMTTTLRTAKFK